MANSDLVEQSLGAEARVTLGLLDAVHENSAVTQRTLANELGVALGLANSYLKRCVKKGLIKVKQVPTNRYAYYLTPKGFAEKGRLTREYLQQSFTFFRVARADTVEILKFCRNQGWKRVALLGKSELAEITVLSATEQDIPLAGIIDGEASQTTDSFMGLPMVAEAKVLMPLHAIIVTDLRAPQETFDEITQHFDADRVMTAPFLKVKRNGGQS